MAHTARTEDDKVEFFDSPDALDEKITTLAQWIKQASHFIAFTGAGISTAAGIPDFRSGMNTVLETGPGAWELRAKGETRSKKRKNGSLKAVISQNTDGLHRRSGLGKQELYELHGNSNLEVCKSCRREYLRDFRTRSAAKVHNHLTGRKCDDPHCRGKLRDTIINFGEDLPEDVLEASLKHAKVADLCLAMGSSLTVTPAADIPKIVGKKRIETGGLVVVNLQKTPLDHLASMRIHAKCEDVSRLLMDKLGVPIPEFRLRRKIQISQKIASHLPSCEVSVQGLSSDGFPFSFIEKVEFRLSSLKETTVSKEPFTFTIPNTKQPRMSLQLKVCFFAHYGEPSLDFKWEEKSTKNVTKIYTLEFDPFTQKWADLVVGVDDLAAKLEAAAL
ncbi:uncharacterized protein LOC134180532 isoform X2 [Corticium candelabrum]|uniref:uncharacterized protein LOC134180532 isoform X2 n=1 Tax=Corticium candelabrum TaxID=121492 RepID=UPI002E25F7BB|nr:uncharacterized protein LOC134180532 isoform X2 [Corticium candelabrum]